MFNFYFLFITLSSLTICNAQNYCNIQNCEGKPHTLCLYPSTKLSNRCTNLISQRLTPNEKHTIVALHNMLRQKVARGEEHRGKTGPQPPTKNMPNLTWDNQLEEIAQRWANQCQIGHDKCRNVQAYPVGQNVVQKWHSNPSVIALEDLVKMWYEEVKDFDARDIAKYRFDYKTGHYTQMVWATTTTIGCGMVRYKDRQMSTLNLVCNYGPAGNVIGTPVYETK